MGVQTVIFSEVYSAYFNAVAAVITEAIDGNLTYKRVDEIVRERAFSESVLTIIPALKSGEWALLDKDCITPIRHKPLLPPTTPEKRWLKAISLDPRVSLFDVNLSGLEDVEPLFEPRDTVYFDRYTDGDSFTDPGYITRFRMILRALREHRQLHIVYHNRHGKPISGRFIPRKLEYSVKDDKFRLDTTDRYLAVYINLQRITECELADNFDPDSLENTISLKRRESNVHFTLKNERNALERVMLSFSDCRKETRRLENGMYEVDLTYDTGDETEILIRILSFGPMIKVISPDRFIGLIRERLTMQKQISRALANSSL
jgi:hypothetical protein